MLQRTSGGTEKQIFALRKTIRHHYRQVIYLDLAFAAENEVEPCLWKYVFYKQIEELRKLLRQFAPSPTAVSLTPGGRPPVPGAPVGVVKEHSDRYARLSTFFRQFLRDSKKFYRSLLNYHLKVAKIHRVGGKFRDLLVKGRRRVVDDEDDLFDDEDEDDEEDVDVEEASVSGNGGGSDHESNDGPDSKDSQEGEQPNSSSFSVPGAGTSSSSSLTSSGSSSKSYTALELHTMHLALLTCHRSLIFLGDLERYSQLILGPSPDHAAEKDAKDARDHRWSKAERYYRWALTIMSCNGNPHNQLAVVATYKQNNLLAVHRYFRSIAVLQPFSTAMQNLKLLFDKQVSLNAMLHQQHAQHHPHSKVTCAWYAHSMLSIKQVDTFIVHLLDVLYTGRNVDSGLCLIHSVVQRIEHFLLNSAIMLHSAGGVGNAGGSLNVYVLQLLLNAIFCIHQHVPSTHIITSDGAHDEEKKAVAVVPTQGGAKQAMPSAPPLPPSFFTEPASGSLAFLFLFDLLRGFMSSMSGVHPQSLHKLGVVAIWCDWLQLHPTFIDPLPIFSSPHSPRSQPSDEAEKGPVAIAASASSPPGSLPSSPFLEHQRLIRTRCWQAFASLCNLLTLCVDNTAPDIIDAAQLPDQAPLKEELEVYGFSYLSAAYPALTHDFYYRRSDLQSIAELTGQKESHSPPSVSASTVVGGTASFSMASKISPSLAPVGAKGREGQGRMTGVSLDKRQYRRALKVLRFAHFLLKGYSVLKQEQSTGRFFVETDIHEEEAAPINTAAITSQQHLHFMQHSGTMNVAPTGGHVPGVGGGVRGSQGLSLSLGGGRGGAPPAAQMRGLIPQSQQGSASSRLPPSSADAVSMGSQASLPLGMNSHQQQQTASYHQLQQQQMAAMRGGMDDYGVGGQRGSLKPQQQQRASLDRGGPSMRSTPSSGQLPSHEEVHSSWRDSPSHHQQPSHVSQVQSSRSSRSSQVQQGPAAPVPTRPSADFSAPSMFGHHGMGDDDLDIDAMLQHRMEDEKRRQWQETESESAQNAQTFDLPPSSSSPSSSPLYSSHVKGLINPPQPPRTSTSNPNLSLSALRSPSDSLAINTADLPSSRPRPSSSSSSSSSLFPEPISAGAIVGKTSPAVGGDPLSRESNGSPGAEPRHFLYPSAPGQHHRPTASSPPLNGRPSDGWENYHGSAGMGPGSSSLQAAPQAEDSAEASSSRGWTPFDSQTALPFSFLHSSSLFSKSSSPGSLAEYEAQQHSLFEQQRRESFNQPGAAESLDRMPSPSSRSPSPVLQQPSATSPQPGYGGGSMMQGHAAPGPPGFRGGLIPNPRTSGGRGSDGGSGGLSGVSGGGGGGGMFGLSSGQSSSSALREGDRGLLSGRGVVSSQSQLLTQAPGPSPVWAGSISAGLTDAYSRSMHFGQGGSSRGRGLVDDSHAADGGAAEQWPQHSSREERNSRIEDDIGLDDLLHDEQDALDVQQQQQQYHQSYHQSQQPQQQQSRYPSSVSQSHGQQRRSQYSGGGGGAPQMSSAQPQQSTAASHLRSSSTSSSSSSAAPYRPPHLQHRENAQPQPYDGAYGESSKAPTGHRSSSGSHAAPSSYQGGMYSSSTSNSASSRPSPFQGNAPPSGAQLSSFPSSLRFPPPPSSGSSPTSAYPPGSSGRGAQSK